MLKVAAGPPGKLWVTLPYSAEGVARITRTPTTPRARLLAKLVGIVGCWLHFAWRVGRMIGAL